MIDWDRDQNLIIAAILFVLALLSLMFCSGCALPPQGHDTIHASVYQMRAADKITSATLDMQTHSLLAMSGDLTTSLSLAIDREGAVRTGAVRTRPHNSAVAIMQIVGGFLAGLLVSGGGVP